MSGTLPIVLIVVVWLFVLAPIALRGRKPIRHTNDAFEETRVIHSGGQQISTSRRLPKPAGAHLAGTESSDDTELEDDDDILLDDRIDNAAAHWDEDAATTKFSEHDAEYDAEFASNAVESAELEDVEEYAEFEDVEAQPETGSEVMPRGNAVRAYSITEDTVVAELEESEPVGPTAVAYNLNSGAWDAHDYDKDGEEQYYQYDDAYTNPAEYLHDGADYGEIDEDDGSEVAVDSVDLSEAELSEEDLEFAARRRGRGGFDPEADAAASANRYQRRQRTLLALVALVVIGLTSGFIFGTWGWIAHAVAVCLTAGYLIVLRNQVQQEQALRVRRIAHMRRARMGVRSSEAEELGVPARLRRPGAVVLELDDESPDFSELPETHAEFEDTDTQEETHSRPRRVS